MERYGFEDVVSMVLDEVLGAGSEWLLGGDVYIFARLVELLGE